MPPLMFWFTGTAIATLVALLATTATLSFGWYRAAVTEMDAAKNKAESAEQRQRVETVKALLGKALSDGNNLLRAINKGMETEQATKDAEAWVKKTHDLIAAAYGQGEADLFLDNSGYTFFADQTPTSGVRNWVDGRKQRLASLIPRTDTLPLRKEFNPTNF